MQETSGPGARLEINDLAKDYVTDGQLKKIVRGVSLTIEPGQFYSLLGPSGCGKTTTLRCVAGLENADGGEIRLAGERLSGNGEHVSPDHRDIGMVFQNYAIWPHMTVFENVAFPLKVRSPRLSKAEITKNVEDALALVRLSDLIQRPAVAMSGGQQQRLALARALVRKPALLLLDEPLSNLDAKLRDDMRLELRDLQSRLGITTLYVTHDQSEALSMSDRVAVMSQGQIVQEGSPREIYQQPGSRFVADFVGRANLVRGEVLERLPSGDMLVQTLGGVLQTACPGDSPVGASVTLSVRPENIRTHASAPDTANVLEGVVAKVEFLGEILGCEIRIGDHTVVVRQSPLSRPETGDRVFLELPRESCTVLVDEPAVI